MAGAPAGMGSVCGLALPLLILCWEVGDSSDFKDPSPSGPCPVVTTNTSRVLTAMPGVSTSLEEAFLTPDLAKSTAAGRLPVETPTLGTETLSKTLTPAAIAFKNETEETLTISLAQTPGKRRPPFPVTKVRDTQTTFPVTETRDTQATSPVAETRGNPIIPSASDNRGTQPTSPALEEATPLATEFRDTQATFRAAETRHTPNIPYVSESRDTQTVAPPSETRETQKTIPPLPDTRTLTKIIPSDSMAAITVPVETLDPSGSSVRTGETTAETRPGSHPTKAIFDTLCTDDSSEEARWITNVLTLLRTSGEAESLSSDGSFSSDNSVAIVTTSQALGPDVAVPSKALVPYSTTHIKFLRETETAAVNSGTSDTDHSSTGVTALSTSETPALPASPSPSPTSPAETLSTASTSESAAPNTIPEASLPTSTTETEVTSALAPAPGGTQVTVSMGPLGETSALSQQSYTTVSGAVTVSAKAASTEGKMTSFAGSSASVSSSSEGLTIKNSTLSETFTTEDTTSMAFPTSRSPLSSVHPTTASSRQETSVTSAKTVTLPKTSSESLITENTISRAVSTSTGPFLSVYPTIDSTQETNVTLAMTISSPKTPSKTFTTDRAFPTRSPLSPVHLTTASSSQETRVTSAVTTTSPKIPSETFIREGTTDRAFTASSPLPSVLPTTANLSQETTVTSASTMTSPKIPSEIFTTDGTTSRAFPTTRIPLSSVLPTTVTYSQDTNVTSAMTKTSPKTQRKPPTAVSSTVWIRQTPEVTVVLLPLWTSVSPPVVKETALGADGGFLLVRLRVASMEDLTEPTQAERLVRQLQCELQASLPLARLSLLHIQSS